VFRADRRWEPSSYTLSWDAATDNVSPSRRIVYLVYQANATGTENFSTRPPRRLPARPLSQRRRFSPIRPSTSSSERKIRPATSTANRRAARPEPVPVTSLA